MPGFINKPRSGEIYRLNMSATRVLVKLTWSAAAISRDFLEALSGDWAACTVQIPSSRPCGAVLSAGLAPRVRRVGVPDGGTAWDGE